MEFNKQAGQASRILLILAVVVLVAAIIVYLVMKMATPPAPPPVPTTPEVPLPVYEQPLGEIRFVFISALDKGSVLRASQITNKQYSTYSNLKDYVIENTGAKFIQITVGAQNIGLLNMEQNSWDIENIVDSDGRNFVPLSGYEVTPWLPNPDLCGELLKPAFNPTPCTKIYEVSKESKGLKIRVRTGKENKANNLSSGKIDSYLLDLIVK